MRFLSSRVSTVGALHSPYIQQTSISVAFSKLFVSRARRPLMAGRCVSPYPPESLSTYCQCLCHTCRVCHDRCYSPSILSRAGWTSCRRGRFPPSPGVRSCLAAEPPAASRSSRRWRRFGIRSCRDSQRSTPTAAAGKEWQVVSEASTETLS